jgi:monofunctional biosynthetic peptidoglycan transglycosylase
MKLLEQLVRWVGRAALLAIGVVLAVQVWYLGWVAYWKWENPEQTAFMERDLERMREKNPQAALRHQWVPYARISGNLKRAVITAEDARFVEHEGVDWEAMQKAYEDNVKRGKQARGGSTISQQLAKNLFLSGERSYVRKAQELVITVMIEYVWDKQRILEVYLNVVEWGDGVFGAEAAARHYYGVTAAQVSPEQGARLAAYLPSPKRYGRIRTGEYLDGRAAAIQQFMHAAQVP